MAGGFVWEPTREHLTRSNVARFMAARGIGTAEELIRRSVDDPAWFWRAVVDALGIRFSTPFREVVDTSQGAPWARWFVGGRLNLVESVIDRHVEGGGGSRTAVVWEAEDGQVRSWSYDELLKWTCRVANVLKGLGVGRGDRVGLYLPMVPEAVAAFLGVARIGAIAVPIFSGFGAGAVAARLTDSGAVVLVTADGFLRKGSRVEMKKVADQAVADSPTVRSVVVVRRMAGEIQWREGDIDLEREAGGVSDACPREEMDAEDPFLIAYTSGTTGKPKGAVHVHGGFLVKIAQEVAHQVDMTAHDRLFWNTDLGWIMGPWEIVGGLASGGAIVLYDGAPEVPRVDRIWSLVERHGVTILGVSPTLVRALMRHGEEPVWRHDLSSLRILASTGEPWNPDPWRWYFDVVGGGRCPLINLSGGTEVAACFLSPLPIAPLKPCTLGGPALGMDIAVVDPQGREVAAGTVGELVCRKPWPGMTRGLWGDPERYLETYWRRFPGMWTHGDWASVDEDGLWYLHGRSDDTLNVAGKRIGPAEVESILVGHVAVSEAAAVGVPDDVKGEVVCCLVVLKPGVVGNDELRAALAAVVVQELGKAFAPKEIRFVAGLPKTRNAKILRRAIRARLLGHDPGDLSNLENPEALEGIARAR